MITQITPSVGNTKIAVWGSGQGEPAIVFMAGGLCDHRSWMPQLLTLRVNRRLLAFDPRGCGMSEGPGPYDILQQASDVAAVITSILAKPAVIVSHSLGGYAALLLNHYHPELVSANVFVDVPLSEKGADTTAMVNALQEKGSLVPLTRMVESMVALATPEVSDVIRDMMLTHPVEVASGMLSKLDAVTHDVTGFVAKAAAKSCLAIWPGPKPAGGDPAWLARTFPSIQQEVVNGVGHFVQLEQPETLNLLLARFISNLVE